MGWPRRRIASVLGGVCHLRQTEFGGRRPYHFHDERQAEPPSGGRCGWTPSRGAGRPVQPEGVRRPTRRVRSATSWLSRSISVRAAPPRVEAREACPVTLARPHGSAAGGARRRTSGSAAMLPALNRAPRSAVGEEVRFEFKLDGTGPRRRAGRTSAASHPSPGVYAIRFDRLPRRCSRGAHPAHPCGLAWSADRARRGISGALYSQSALARPNSLPRGRRPRGQPVEDGGDGPGSRARSARESGQVRGGSSLPSGNRSGAAGLTRAGATRAPAPVSRSSTEGARSTYSSRA